MIRTTVLALALAASFGASAAPVEYKLDPAHTVVLASWSHFGYSHPSANFGQVDGTLLYDADDVATSTSASASESAGARARRLPWRPWRWWPSRRSPSR